MPSSSSSFDRLVDLAYAALQFGVVGMRHAQEFDALFAQLVHRVQNVVGGQRDVLHAGAGIKVEILLDLRFLFALGRLVDGEFHIAVAVGHHLGHERRVFGGNILVVEVLVEREAHDVGVEIDPLVHLVPAHIAHHVIHVQQARGARDGVDDSTARKPGRKGPW